VKQQPFLVFAPASRPVEAVTIPGSAPASRSVEEKVHMDLAQSVTFFQSKMLKTLNKYQ
jgi:hypothetical protein